MSDEEAIERARDKQLDKYLDEQEGNEEVSNCCGEPICGESDICCGCKEHCVPTSFAEFAADEEEAAMCDRADAERELAREEEW